MVTHNSASYSSRAGCADCNSACPAGHRSVCAQHAKTVSIAMLRSTFTPCKDTHRRLADVHRAQPTDGPMDRGDRLSRPIVMMMMMIFLFGSCMHVCRIRTPTATPGWFTCEPKVCNSTTTVGTDVEKRRLLCSCLTGTPHITAPCSTPTLCAQRTGCYRAFCRIASLRTRRGDLLARRPSIHSVHPCMHPYSTVWHPACPSLSQSCTSVLSSACTPSPHRPTVRHPLTHVSQGPFEITLPRLSHAGCSD